MEPDTTAALTRPLWGHWISLRAPSPSLVSMPPPVLIHELRKEGSEVPARAVKQCHGKDLGTSTSVTGPLWNRARVSPLTRMAGSDVT